MNDVLDMGDQEYSSCMRDVTFGQSNRLYDTLRLPPQRENQPSLSAQFGLNPVSPSVSRACLIESF